MSDGFAVDLEQLEQFVERLGGFERGLDRVRDDVEARMHRVGAVWSGRAAAEHLEAHRQWAAGALEMHEALATLRSIATTAHGNYGAALTANARMWAR